MAIMFDGLDVCLLDDDHIAKLLAGGVLGLTPLPSFLVQDPAKATIRDYVDHIDYAVELMGIDHVGVGFDFGTGHTTETLVPEGYVKWGGTHILSGFESSLAAMRAAGQSENDTLCGQPYAAGVADHSQVGNVAVELGKRGYPATAIGAAVALLRESDQRWCYRLVGRRCRDVDSRADRSRLSSGIPVSGRRRCSLGQPAGAARGHAVRHGS